MYFSYRQALWFCKSHVWKKMWLRGPFLISIFSYLIYVPYLKPDYQQNRLTKQLWKLPKVIKVINLPTYLVLQGVEIQLNYFISNAGLFVPNFLHQSLSVGQASLFENWNCIYFANHNVNSSKYVWDCMPLESVYLCTLFYNFATQETKNEKYLKIP